jgi:alkylhydroperoxidase family enzyme
MRLPYVSENVEPENPAEAAIVQRVKSRRVKTGLLELDLALFHALPLADGWNSFFGSIRSQTSLPTDIRELAISRVGFLTGSQYEWSQHAPLAIEAGVTADSMKGNGEGLSADKVAVLRYADAMTKDIEVPEAVFKELRSHFTGKEVVELTVTIAAYNCCSRFLVALDVGERNGLTDEKDWQG